MDVFFPGFIMGFREGLEAFLIVAVLLQYLTKNKRSKLKVQVYTGAFVGAIISAAIGALVFQLFNSLENMDKFSKIWESVASLLALVLVTTFIYWMIQQGRSVTALVEGNASRNMTAMGIASVSFVLVVREGVEISIFTLAGSYTLLSILAGLSVALLLAFLIHHSLVKVNLKLLFSVTLAYLILQAGFLLGYGIHEGLSAMHELGFLSDGNPLLITLFDLTNTVFYHKEGIVGLPLFILFGWHSKPEILQFAMQYLYTISAFVFWIASSKKNTTVLKR